MSEATLWLIVTGFFVSLELLTRSAYLFMLGLGAAAAAMLANFGLPQSVQLVAAAGVGGIGVVAWHFHLLKRGPLPDSTGFASELPQVEIGAHVEVEHWEADGTCKIHHQGVVCVGRHFGPHLPALGRHRIKSVDGFVVMLEQV